VAEFIDHVEEFGDISTDVKRKISMILSRHRQLKNHLIPLFLGPTEESLEMFDCAKMDEQGFQQMAYSCPNLVQLNLSLCGRLTGKAMKND
jgi:DNA repair protein RAD7